MANKNNEKVYLPSTFGKVVTFQDGGEIINVDFIDADSLTKFITDNSVDNKFRITIQKQKNDPTKASITLNTYTPKVQVEEEDGDSLPF